ncbi:MAG: hypothetical protein R3F11_29440 [Verrucomicrobiales bacterium]
MTDIALYRQLIPIAERSRQARRLFWTALLVGLGVLLAAAVWFSAGPLRTGAVLVLALGIAAIGAFVWWVAGRRRLTLQGAARLVRDLPEDRRAALMAAVEQQRGADGSFDFLQRRLLHEAARDAVASGWGETVSAGKLRAAKLSFGAALALWLAGVAGGLVEGVVPGLLGGSQVGGDIAAELNATAAGQPVVDPGDAEVERGAKLVVTAAFPPSGAIPGEATLQIDYANGEGAAIPMRQALGDPVFGAVIEAVPGDAAYRIAFAGGKTRDFSIKAFDLPRLERADATIRPPSYAGLPEERIEKVRRITALEGSEIAIDLVLNKAVSKAELVRVDQANPKPKREPAADDGVSAASPLDDDDRQDADATLAAAAVGDAEPPFTYRVVFSPKEDLKLALHLVDENGRENRDAEQFTIKLKRNLPPKIEIAFPKKDAAVTPIQELPIEATVWDDVKVQAAGAVYAFNGEEVAIPFPSDGFKPDEKSPVAALLKLEELGAAPNQLVSYYFWAEDEDAEGKPRRVQSDMFFAEVRHFEEIFREAPPQAGQPGEQQQQQGQQGQAEEMMKGQKEIINATWTVKRNAASGEGKEGDAAVVAEGQRAVQEKSEAALEEIQDAEAAAHLRAAIEQMAAAAEKLDGEAIDEALAAEQKAYEHLLHLRAREHEVMMANQQQQQQGGSSAQQQQRQMQLQQMKLKEEARRYEEERTARAEQREQQAQQRQEDIQILSRLKELARRQEAVAEKLRELENALAEAETAEEKAEIERQLKRLRDEQRELLEDADAVRERMDREENRARTAEARDQLEQAREQANQAEEAAAKGDAAEAASAATRAQRQLRDLQEDFQKQTGSQFADAMREMRDEAQDLAERQEDIGRQLEEQIARGAQAKADPFEAPAAEQALRDALETQGKALDDLLGEMRETSEQAEEAEPVLSRKL